jgi:hypothetical protein
MQIIDGTSRPLAITYRAQPFTGRVYRTVLPQGLTCAEIIAQVPDLDTRRFLEIGTFCINGEVVPRELWTYVRPKSRNDIIVTMHMPIRGGAGQAVKDAVRIVAAIALVVVASLVTAGAAAGILGPSFAAGTLGAQILAGAISVGGALLLGAFVKPPSKPDEPEPELGGNAALIGNQLKRGTSVPRTVGTIRAFPPLLSQPLVDLDEYDEVVEAVYGFAGPHKLRDIKFGDVFADDIDPEFFQYQAYELLPGEGGIDDFTCIYLPLTGAQDGNDFTDYSRFERTITATGSVFIDKNLRETWPARSAAYFDQSDSIAFLSTPATPDIQYGDADFSIELNLEFDPNIGTAGTLYYIAGQALPNIPILTAADVSWYAFMETTGVLRFVVSDGSNFFTVTGTTNLTEVGEGDYYHILMQRVGNVLRIFVNEQQEGGDVVFTGEVPTINAAICLGTRRASATSQGWPGWLSGYRIQLGEAAYESGEFERPEIVYKPPLPTLITRYGKTAQPNIRLAKHQIDNGDDPDDQPSRDILSNQFVPERSSPAAQTVVARGRSLDEVWVTLTFAAGMSYFDDDFESDWFNGVAFRIRIRELGGKVWRNLPEVHVHDRRTAPFLRMLVFRWDNEVLPGGKATANPPSGKGWRAAYTSVPTQTITPAGIGGWEADEHFQASGSSVTYLAGQKNNGGNIASTGLRNIRLTTERAEFFLNTLVDKGPLEIEIRRSQLYIASKFNYTTYVMNTNPPDDSVANGVVDLFGYLTLSNSFRTLLKQSNAGDDIIVGRVASVWNTPPIARWGTFAPIYARIKGRNLDALSVKASGLVPDYDSDTERWEGLHATSNPAPHYRDILIGSLNDNRIPESLVNDQVLVEWRERCDEFGFTCDAVFENNTVERALEVVASCGYARPRQAELWDVAQDRDFTFVNPVQMFTPRNMRNFRWEKAFLRQRPDGLRVKFTDAAEDYTERTIIVPRPDLLGAATSRLEEIRYEGLVSERNAVTKAVYDQRQVTERFTFYYGEVDAEHLVCRRGDLVLVQHDTLDRFAGYSRILSTTKVDGEITSITLDGSVLQPSELRFFEASPVFFSGGSIDFFSDSIGIVIRRKDGTSITLSAALSPNGFVLYPTIPIDDSDNLIERECLVMMGRLLKTSRRMVVFDIQPRTDLTAQITFVDEAPAVWDFPPELPSQPPAISSVRLYQQYADIVYTPDPGRVQLFQQYADIVYTPDPGRVQLFHQYVEVVYTPAFDLFVPEGTLEGELYHVRTITATTQTIGPVSSIREGDLLVLFDIANGAAPQPVTVLADGFAQLFNMVSGTGNTRVIGSYKIADGAESYTALTGMNGVSSNQKILAVYRKHLVPISSIAVATTTPEFNTGGNPTPQVIPAGAMATPCIAFGCYASGTPAAPIDPRTFTPTKDREHTVTSGFTMYLASKIFNVSSEDVTIDMDNEGAANILAGFVLECM